MHTEKEFHHLLRKKWREAEINKESIDESIRLFDNILLETSPIYNHDKNPFIVWEDWSFIYDYVEYWDRKWNSIIYYASDIGKIMVWYKANVLFYNKNIRFDRYNLYDIVTSKEFIYDMWVVHANRTNQKRSFTCFSWVYLLYSKWEVVYVWQSNNIFNRISWHRDKEYDKIEFIPVHIRDGSCNRLKIEYDLIKKHKPKYNSMHNKVSIQSALDSWEYIED